MNSKILASCPISSRQVDTNTVRVISFQVALLSVTLLFTQEIFFALVLLFDFTVRALRFTKLSPFHLIAKFILTGWRVSPKFSDESLKRFALYLGLAISSVLILLFLIGFTDFAMFIVLILLVCALCEPKSVNRK